MAEALVKPQIMATIHMNISPISELDAIHSSEVSIHGIPWKVQAIKNEEENSLGFCLRCAENNDSLEWSVPACATVSLIPYDRKKNALVHHISPYIFTSSSRCFGYSDVIQWDELMRSKNKYVQDDTIQLKIEIMAEDPNYVERSMLKFDNIDKWCDCGSHVTYRLTVGNIENLMAVRSPQFIVRDLPWNLIIYKSQTPTLGVMLDSIESSNETSCKMTMSVKLLSSKNDVNPVEKTTTAQIQCPDLLDIEDLISWDELLKPKNGFVHNRSITLDVELKANKPDDDDAQNVETYDEAKLLMKPQVSTVHMVISSISKLHNVRSPKVYIHGIPWQVGAHKNEEKNSLAVYLHCSKYDDLLNWTVPGCATVKLLSFDNKKDAYEEHITPSVFNTSCHCYGACVIQWDDLLNDENKYVQNDTIELKVDITVEDPNYVDKSVLKFKNIDKNDDAGSTANFRLTVENVTNLMAVRSSQFVLHAFPLYLTVYKHPKSTLGILLATIESCKKLSCETTMSVKLLSSKDGVNAIEESITDEVQWQNYLDIESIISWDEMLKPENGFVNDDLIILEVELKTNKPDDAERNNAAKRRRLECSICLKEMANQDISSTKCGHMFCTACITKVVEDRGDCPLCNKPVQLDDLRCSFLPVTN